MLKNIVIAIVLGVAAFVLSEVLDSQGSVIPNDAASVGQLLVMIAAVFVGGLLTGGNAGYEDDAETGTVKWFNVKKGYGFITRDQGDDVFVHYRNIEGEGRRSISEGQRVSFKVVSGEKGLQADEVTAI